MLCDNALAKQNEIDVLQIVFPCAFDDDVGHEVDYTIKIES